MSMIQCPECGQAVSNKAASCPHCGYSPPKGGSRQDGAVVLVVIGTVLCSIGVVGCQMGGEFAERYTLFFFLAGILTFLAGRMMQP